MGIQINGQTDSISAIDGSLSIQGGDLGSASASSLNITGIVTATTLRATDIVGVVTAGITTAYVTSINDGPLSGFRNRIINGDCRIDQRNNGASVTVTADGFGNRVFPIDRFTIQKTGACQIAGIQTSDVPTGQGFSNALRATVSTIDSSVTGTDYAVINHRIEGFNISDLEYGSSSAKILTLSFWVKSSVTGTYCLSFGNSADNRSRIVEYTINSANTWEYETITIPGDVSGTWEKRNSNGMNIFWCLGAGSTYQSTGNTWNSSLFFGTSNQTQWISNASATFFLTGIQLESGNVASAFERRSYGQELALCQRYAYAWGMNGPQYAAAYTSGLYWDANQITMMPFGVDISLMRAIPSAITAVGTQGTDWLVQSAAGVNQTGFTVTTSNGVITASKTSHGLSNGAANLQGKIVISSEL